MYPMFGSFVKVPVGRHKYNCNNITERCLCSQTSPFVRMLNFASSCIAVDLELKDDSLNSSQAAAECSDDETCSVPGREETLECPICRESFNIVENIPYVLWCGHTLCKNCILGLHWAVVKFPTLPIQLPLFISCPWCNLLSFRLVYRGNLKFPRKNYFLVWMVETMNGDRGKSGSDFSKEQQQQPIWPVNNNTIIERAIPHSEELEPNHDNGDEINFLSLERVHSSLRKSLVFFVHLTAKFPLLIFFLLILFYAVPASAIILALYILVTLFFALPSFLILYSAYPSLDWLVREIIA